MPTEQSGYGGKPTEKQFQDLLTHYTRVYAGAITVWEKIQSYYFGTADIWAELYARNPLYPKGSLPPFSPGLFPSKVNQIVAGHLAFEPKITRRPVADGRAHKDHADELEKGNQALVHDIFGRNTNFPTKVAGKNLVLFDYTSGYTHLNTMGIERPTRRDGESAESFEEREEEWLFKHKHWNPIEIDILTPGEVLMDPFEANPPVALWKQSGTAWDLAETIIDARRRHAMFKGKFPQFDDVFAGDFSYSDPWEIKEFIHWYTSRWHGIYINGGQNVLWEPNMWGIQPFRHVWAGDLITPVGDRFDLADWARQSMMYQVIDEVVMEAQATVSDHQLLFRHANARLVYPGNTAELAQNLRATGVLSASKDELNIEPVPDVMPASFNHRAALGAAIDRHTVSPIDAGFQDLRTETATGIAIKAENTSRQVQAPRIKMEHLFAGVVGDANRIIFHSHKMMDKTSDGQDVPSPRFKEIGVGEAKVRVVDMEEEFHFQVSFSQTDLASKLQAESSMWQAYDRGVVGDGYARKVLGLENEKEAEEDVLQTMLRKHPEYALELLIQTARKNNLNEIADTLEAELEEMKMARLQREAQAAVGGMGGAPVQTGVGRNGNRNERVG